MTATSLPLEATMGWLFIGFAFASVLFGVTTTQYYWMNKNYPNDALWLKSLAFVIWMLELGHQIALSYSLWMLIVHNTGSFPVLEPLPLTLYISGILSNLATFLVRQFFIYRFWSISRNLFYTAFLILIALSSSTLYLVTSIKGLQGPSLAEWATYSHLSVATAALATFSDFTIAVCTCWRLLYTRSDSTHKTTHRILDRLIKWSLETGVMMVIVSGFVAILAATMKKSLLWTVFWMIVVRCYSNAFFAVLNGRDGLRSIEPSLSTRQFPTNISQPGISAHHSRTSTSIQVASLPNIANNPHGAASFPLSPVSSRGTRHKTTESEGIKVDIEVSSVVDYTPSKETRSIIDP